MVSAARIIPNLERLMEGEAEPVILIVDFIPFSSAQRVGALLCAHASDREIYQIDPVTDLAPSGSYVPLNDLGTAYAQALAACGLAERPILVVGYCSAAPLALVIGSELSRIAHVSSVLLRPTRPDPEMIAADFARFQADLSVAAAARPDLDGKPDTVLEQMMATLEHDLMTMAAANGFDPASSVLTEMLVRYRSWLGFLLAGSVDDLPLPPAQFPIPVVLSKDDPEELSWLGATRVVRVPAGDNQFPECPYVASEILDRRF